MDYQIIAVGNIELKVKKDFTSDLLIEKKDDVERIWQAEVDKNDKLFNGLFLNYHSIEKSEDAVEAFGHFVEYKNFIAQRLESGLDLNIKPIGVSGLSVFEDAGEEYVLLAKRSKDVTQYPGCLELVPSGTIDGQFMKENGVVDYQAQLENEFYEETGLPKGSVIDVKGFALILDTQDSVYDVCCKVTFKADSKNIIDGMKLSGEYNEPQCVALNDLSDFVRENKDGIIPCSRAVIEAYAQSSCSNVY